MKSSRYPGRTRIDLTDTYLSIDGITYRLTVEAYETNKGNAAIYEAKAIRTDEHPDEDGYQQLYLLQWDIMIDWDGYDEAYACDWEYPDNIEPYDLALME